MSGLVTWVILFEVSVKLELETFLATRLNWEECNTSQSSSVSKIKVHVSYTCIECTSDDLIPLSPFITIAYRILQYVNVM